MFRSKPAVEQLKSVSLFDGLPERELKTIAGELRDVKFKAGEVMVAEGDTTGRFFLIIDGYATVTVNGEKRADLGPGRYFGDLSVIDRGPRSATVAASTDVEAKWMPSTEFLALVEQHWSIGYKVMLGLCRRVRDAEHDLTTVH
ncbi:MAG TPA: cyclic nucleotide-binding domain-containing protein [Acidimicrobiales bacterium]|nr:cyclic nucleotide-binding domain-containing protein [Acidimicrobiales bacterium]